MIRGLLAEVSDERVNELLEALTGVLAEEGRPLPRIAPAEAATIAAIMHGEMDRGTAARADAVRARGRTIACKSGCTTCCETIVTPTEAESLAAARFLALPDNRRARDHFAATYPAWRAAVGDLADRAAAAALVGDGDAVAEAMGEAARRRVPCAFVNDGACSIYAARPNVCRKAHALDTKEPCQAPVDQRAPEILYFLPIEEFLTKLRPLMLNVHRAIRGGGAGEPLCDAVHRLLGDERRSAGVGRNEPCPCASGKKYKHCCGG